MKIKLGNVRITRNYSVPKNCNKEAYSNLFHSDAYTCNLFKIFINLQDVSEAEGPLILVKNNKAKLFLKESSYRNRNLYIKENNNDYYYVNSGKKGDILLCSTTELLHRAGDIKEGKSRDVLFLDFVAYPFDDPGTYIGVKELLNNLDDKYRDIIDMIYFRGFTQKEVSEELDIPLGTVKTRLRIGLRELRGIFDVASVGGVFLFFNSISLL